MQQNQGIAGAGIGKTRTAIGEKRAVIVFSRQGIGKTRMPHRNFTAAELSPAP
jgi:hypothetical protein